MVSGEFRDDIVARIKEESDIVQIIGECVDLKKSGTRFLGLCPFHGEKTPSFSVHSGQQFFHCFGCGESGDVFTFVMKYYSLDFPDAIKLLAGKYNIELPERRRSQEEQMRAQKKDQLFAVNEKAASIYSRYLLESPGARAARAYLQNRGVKEDILTRFRLGYAPAVEVEGWNFLGGRIPGAESKAAVEAGLLVERENGGTYDRFRDRIVFPIADLSGRICGFGGRIVGEGQPKYLNSPESPVFNKSNLLLGLYQQKEDIRRNNEAVLVEGNFDLISLVAAGCTNVVAPLGTALTREQLRLIKRFAERVTLLFDGDAAGIKAAVRGVPLFLAEQIAGRVAVLPEGDDPDTFIRKKGLAPLLQLLERAESLPEFVLHRFIAEFGLTLDGKRQIVEELQPLLKAAVSPLQRSVFAAHFAEKLGIPPEQLAGPSAAAPVAPAAAPAVPGKKRSVERIVPLSISQRQLVEFMILQPQFFPQLEEGGLRECLADGVGEILFLQLKSLLARKNDAEPEELLTVLPEGAERNLVAELLQRAPIHAQGTSEDDSREEFADLLLYLRRYRLKKNSEELMARMQRAQQDGNAGLLQELMMQKMEITRKLHEE
ncbi:DNA primase [Desulfopila sp. IMCC35006]|uniref:DNA primase n=1 Tax=Desulfopila sp. IMCC35006 TaxID=2569542 RepID=UPI0010AC7AF2|nr:DNA primase [Desulfopila sp. IMCC35006]TKB24872.1 DNA primase [Desulfopila sp. IMCC35006]